jgi:tetraacyldisaccharide 4'-kinase
VSALLKPFELLWRGINRTRRALYRAGVLRPKRLPRPVVSVGGITAGGAGKTPAVIAIARDLVRRGLRVVVLTRGYGRAGGGGGVVDELDPGRFGDEPVLIKRSVPEAVVVVGGDRHEQARRIDGNVYLLDDGFQHLQLARDVDVVVDAPGRWHREGRSALRDAGFVIPRRLHVEVEALRGERVFAFAGLADNEQFFAALPNVVGTRRFPDHHRYTAADLEGVRAAARNAGATRIVTTEKDAVKLGDRDIIAVRAEMIIDPRILDAIAARIAAPISSNGTAP